MRYLVKCQIIRKIKRQKESRFKKKIKKNSKKNLKKNDLYQLRNRLLKIKQRLKKINILNAFNKVTFDEILQLFKLN